MIFKSGRIKDFYLLTTEVENIFINEYMPQAPGDFVKVFLYAMLHAEQETEMTHETLAMQLGISEKTVDEAWSYWADMGAVKKTEPTDASKALYGIEFLSLREQMYGGMREKEATRIQETERSQGENVADQRTLCDEKVREIFDFVESLKGCPLSTKELQEISAWLQAFDTDTEVIKRAFSFCYEKNKTGLKYIETIIREWCERGIKTAEEADAYIQTLSKRYGDYKKILGSLGIVGRVATDGEKKLMDKWFDEMGFSAERILEACEKTVGIANPNVNYVNKILENWQKESASFGRDVNKKITVSRAELDNYYEFLRREAKRKAEERKAEVYEKLPRIEEIDEAMKELQIKLSRAVLSGGEKRELAEIKTRAAHFEQERAVILTENNLPLDFTDVKPLCNICRDTGIDENGRRCICVKERIGEAELWVNAKKK